MSIGPPVIDRSAILLTALISMVITGATIIAVGIWHHPTPYFDQWGEMIWGQPENWTLKKLWAPHNEHRIFFPRLFFILDQRFFGGSSSLLLALGLVIQTLHWLLFSWILNHQPTPSKWHHSRISFFLLTVILAFFMNPMQSENFYWGFQIQFFLVYFMASLSVVILSNMGEIAQRRLHSWGCFILCLLSAVVCQYSMSNGVAIWPVLFILAVLARISWLKILFLGIAGALNIYVFFQGYQITEQAVASSSLETLPMVFRFSAQFLGAPLSYNTPFIAETLGYLGWSLVGLGAGLVAFQFQRFKCLIPWLGICGFILASSLIIALGRVNLGLEVSFAIRYATPSFIFWGAVLCASALVLFQSISSNGHFRLLRRLFFIVPLAIITMILLRMPPYIGTWENLWKARESVALALHSKVNDPEMFRRVFPIPHWVEGFGATMEQNQVGPFHPAWWKDPSELYVQTPFPKLVDGISWKVESQSLFPPSRLLSSGIRLEGKTGAEGRGPLQRFSVMDPIGAQRGYGTLFPSGGWVAYKGFPVEPESFEIQDVLWFPDEKILVIVPR